LSLLGIIIEILSPNTASKDLREKLAIYEKHGVKEYWIVHPTDNTLMVFHLKDKAYGKPDIYAKEDKIKTPILNGLEIDLKVVFKE
jgi:Uma2 family endonuclease